jgi:hypothetical protein
MNAAVEDEDPQVYLYMNLGVSSSEFALSRAKAMIPHILQIVS